jgi:hypothetical protein
VWMPKWSDILPVNLGRRSEGVAYLGLVRPNPPRAQPDYSMPITVHVLGLGWPGSVPRETPPDEVRI